MPLELYRPEGPRRTKKATVTIQKDKTLSLNRSAWEAIGEPQHVHLLFDPDDRIIGIKAAEERSPAAINIKQHVGRYFRISAGGFVNQFDIPYDPSRRFHVEIDTSKEGPTLLLDLEAGPDWIGANGSGS